MNEIAVNTTLEHPFHSGAGVYLSTGGRDPEKLSFNIEDYARIPRSFPTDAGEFAYFCALIYGCDRLLKRDTGNGDRWTREIAVEIPVTLPSKWSGTSETIERMLEFLTGDIWRISFRQQKAPLFGSAFSRTRKDFRKKRKITGAAVSLFSGGLDSITGIIDWLEVNPAKSLVLASTYDAHAENAKADQERLLPKLNATYQGRISRFVARSGLQNRGEDINFRSRSLTFLGNGVLAASFLGKDVSILIPENGAIAINYPLSPARSGSLSTRTVHPHFIELFNQLLRELGFSCQVENPYEFKTKGEVLASCKNQKFLRSVYEDSVSCGKRGFSRIHWHDKGAAACGHCVPCIFRQAATTFASFDEEAFGCTVSDHRRWGTSDILRPNSDLQTVVDFVKSELDADLIWRKMRSNGYLRLDKKDQYVDLIVRLRTELKGWLASVKLV
jgi:7-cyano-7-deazaguanine synthase in queuosine biosynthesis